MIKIGAVVAEFNFDITSMMLELAKEHAKFLDAEITEVFPVPGVYDMPIAIKKLLDEVSKITNIKGYDDEMMFTPSENKASLREDVVGEMLSAKEALANTPKKNGNFVEVPVMIND